MKEYLKASAPPINCRDHRPTPVRSMPGYGLAPWITWVATSLPGCCRPWGKQAGTVASIGNAQSIKQPTVFPFILRGVSLLGVDSGYIGDRPAVGVLASAWPPTSSRAIWPATMTRTVPFAELPGVFHDFIEGRVKGRTVIAVKE